ncbi:MAG: hypothetical protein A2Y73_07400 [Chloroflexi bacterium RBG_13_56_8]|nr:MAG: hypothetical protein A2Y73_07400 [Chloroflexi bacterium RBG_13_56_8]
MTRILLVDDEQDLVWELHHALSREGYEVLSAYDGVEALALVRRHRPDLIVLDILMPRLDGLEVCRLLRSNFCLASVPILFLTSRGAIGDRIEGLNEGGDDYLPKPFDLDELKARINALLRRVQFAEKNIGPDHTSAPLTVGSIALDLNTPQIWVNERAVQLTPVEHDLLHYLMIHCGEVVSSKKLMEQIWGDNAKTVDTGPVRWHIMNLRTKIEPDPDHPSYIRTVPHHGYILAENLAPSSLSPHASRHLSGTSKILSESQALGTAVGQ